MTSPLINNRSRKGSSRSWLSRFSLLGGLLLFGFALASPGVSAEFINGRVVGPQLIAGEGFQSIDFINNGNESVTFSLVRLSLGTRPAQFIEAETALTQDSDSAASELTQPQFLMLGDLLGGLKVDAHKEASMAADLRMGTYLIVVDEGAAPTNYMSFMVTGSSEPAEAPKVPNAVGFSDVSFDFPATLTAGKTMWEISNAGTKPQIATFYRLLPGMTESDLVAYLNDSTHTATKPYKKTVELTTLSRGQTVYQTLDFSAGSWVAVSFVPDLSNLQARQVVESMTQAFVVN